MTSKVPRILQRSWGRLSNPNGASSNSAPNWNRRFISATKFLFLGHLFISYVGYIAQTEGPSMLPTLAVDHDWVYISKFYRRGKGIRVGDVVSFKHPMFPSVGALKRVVGMPGDFVLRDTPGSAGRMMIQVPEGHCWVIGDNLPESRDSRTYGPIPLALIKGKAIARVLPLADIKWIENRLQKPEKLELT
ncbi:mitochondrial inner membrane protease subunit protein [Lasallia pustulata]|uniref:Mitochondrial inner membrane protease subunit protein n=1 Tax=Lasallia pustulata TaxID=136370 RepID=A0A1W5D5V8_9LECA|nr:mitochondrial inner membrane protease subunit protein [Lasallia pustulata]